MSESAEPISSHSSEFASQLQSRKTDTHAEASAALKSTTSSTGFTYPAIWSFPPFFTLQRNPTTYAHQATLWIALILGWAKHDRVFMVDIDGADGGGPVFHNKQINRRLQPPAAREILQQMVKDGKAVAEPAKQTSSYLLYWRRPEEWGTVIYDWVAENGMNNSILTFYELTQGDLAHTTDFHLLPHTLLRRALDTLVKKGKAQVFKGEDGEGVKFV